LREGAVAKNPSSIFYWNDWLLDPALAMCSAAAQGLWMRMLAIAAGAEPYGHVQVGDKPCSICDLAQITGWRKQDVSRWSRELDKRGVFSRTEDGTIFCRRMVREAAARAAARQRKRDQASHRGDVRPPGVAHPLPKPKQPDLLDDFEKTRTRARDSDSGSVASSQTQSSISKPLPESLDAPRATQTEQAEERKNITGGPVEVRCAHPARLPTPEQIIDDYRKVPPPTAGPQLRLLKRCWQLRHMRRSTYQRHGADLEAAADEVVFLERMAGHLTDWKSRSPGDRARYDALVAAGAARRPPKPPPLTPLSRERQEAVEKIAIQGWIQPQAHLAHLRWSAMTGTWQ
jgi:hypothetical protein